MRQGFAGTSLLLAAAAVFLSLGAAEAAPSRVRVEAYAGEPFGVGCVEVDLPSSLAPEPLGWSGLGIEEKHHRALYPAVESRSIGGVVQEVLGEVRYPAARILGGMIESHGKARVYFLFQGREPLELTVQSQTPYAARVMPMESQAGHRRLLAAWWKHYTSRPGPLQAKPDYPPILENYLRAMLARRLGLELPERRKGGTWKDELTGELSLLAGTESLRLGVERQRFLSPAASRATADQPLPQAIENPEPTEPDPAPDVPVEPIALRVPAECLYVRFGSFANFLWFQDTLERIGGDFQNLVASRGLDRGIRARFQNQLASELTAMARMLGDKIVADVAIVGTDLFLQEGGAYGLLFQARSNMLLGTSFAQQRQEWKQRVPGTTETKVKIGGREVSFLASPDGLVRSYYVTDGDYHLLTTSKTLAGRFLETRSGKGSLGASREFRHARTVMPLTRNDTVFAYLSGAFFQNLVSPAYRVEMMRRVEATADIELAKMAILASATEGKAGETIEDLVRGEFLPPGFGVRPDGSRTVLEKGDAHDSLRGDRGFMVPIPDMKVTGVTPSEAAAYQQLADLIRTRWGRLDPILAGIRRQPLGENLDRILVDLRMTPLAPSQADLLGRFVGPADPRQLAPIAEDSVALEVMLPQQRIFGGLQQIGPGTEAPGGLDLLLGRLRSLAMGYVGSDGEAGLLGWIPFRPVAPPDAGGYVRGDLGLWQHKTEQFLLLSFQREVLQRVAPQLRFEAAERPAQLRVRVTDLSKSPLASLANAWGYSRSRETSLGNLRLMHQITQQLHIPGDAAKSAAEVLLDARPICPLGGQYVYRQTPEGIGVWTSTAIEGTSRGSLLRPQAPEGYVAPPLNWFRGLKLDATLADSTVAAHAELDMQWPSPAK